MNSEPACGTLEKPMTSTGMEGPPLLDALSLVVDHGRARARTPFWRRRRRPRAASLLDEHRRHGAPALVELGLDDDAAGRPVRVGLHFQDVGLQEDELQQVLDADLLLRRDVGEERVAAPVLRGEVVLGLAPA
jgi:hypothetical protein